jgi:acetoin utilization protein AcuA
MKPGSPQIVQTARGPLELYFNPVVSQVDEWDLDEGIGDFGDFCSLLPRKESMLNASRDSETKLCLAVDSSQRIVAYCLRRPPNCDERWAEMTPPVLFEILAETARGWREAKLMKALLSLLFSEPGNDQRILYIVGYSWTWDMQGTGKDPMQYRETLKSLLAPHGFREYPTNEPNVSLREENILMARIGEGIERPTRKRFTNLLFGIRED